MPFQQKWQNVWCFKAMHVSRAKSLAYVFLSSLEFSRHNILTKINKTHKTMLIPYFHEEMLSCHFTQMVSMHIHITCITIKFACKPTFEVCVSKVGMDPAAFTLLCPDKFVHQKLSQVLMLIVLPFTLLTICYRCLRAAAV